MKLWRGVFFFRKPLPLRTNTITTSRGVTMAATTLQRAVSLPGEDETGSLKTETGFEAGDGRWFVPESLKMLHA